MLDFSKRDDNLRQFATDREWQVLEAYWEHGSERKAAAALKIHQSRIYAIKANVSHKASVRGYAPQSDMHRVVPEGFLVKGTSTLYNGKTGEVTAQWVKTTLDSERQALMASEILKGLAEDLPRADPVQAPDCDTSKLMTIYPVGDHHLGMYAWHEEAGGDYDLVIGERLLCRAFDCLTETSPKGSTAAVVFLGDFLHYDSMVPVTPTSNNPLDSDSRFAKLVRVAVRTMRYSINAALKRHSSVLVIVEIGNHDPVSSIFLAEAMANVYENEPRVKVDRSPRHYHYFSHGKCLVGVHHGHGTKLENLPLIMATDMHEQWGKSLHRYWLTGHVHKDRRVDVQGTVVESFRVLPPTDAWADKSGYRSQAGMVAMVLHPEHGEVARTRVNPAMLK